MAIPDVVNFAMLVCASIGSMAFGILAAYFILRVVFLLIRPPRASAPVPAVVTPPAVQPEAAQSL
jgi:hypothetical protein